MNKRKLLLLVFGFCCTSIMAQNDAQVARHDSLLRVGLTMTRYDKDTSADAVVLSAFGIVRIVPELYGTYKYYKRSTTIKILSQTGLSNGEVSIPLFHFGNNKEEILDLDAITYNLDGDKIVASALDKKTIYEQEIPPYVKIEKIAMPDVKVGSLVYISYTIKSPYPTNFQWNFQQKIPVVYSQFTLFMPPTYTYVVYKQYLDDNNSIEQSWQDNILRQFPVRVNMSSLGYNQGYYDNVYSCTVKDISAFKDESFITTPEDYMIQIGFQLTKYGDRGSFFNTWQQFTNKLLLDTYFADYYETKWGKLGDIIDGLKIKGKPQTEKLKTIVNYVKANYKWNKNYNYRTSKKMTDFLTEKSGTVPILIFFCWLY